MTKIYLKRTPKENADKISEAIKDIKSEMRAIKRDIRERGTDIGEFFEIDINDMSSGEAFDRGYYRALESILSDLKQ